MKTKNLIPISSLKNIKISLEYFNNIENEIVKHETKNVAINNDEQYVVEGARLKEIKNLLRSIEEKERELEAPLKLALQYIKNDVFKPYIERLKKLETKIKNEISIYDDKKKKEEEERRKNLEEAFKKTNPEISEDISIITNNTTPKVAGVRISYRYDFEIVDENLIPREFLKVDDVKLRRVINALKEETKIPGIKVVKKKIIGA